MQATGLIQKKNITIMKKSLITFALALACATAGTATGQAIAYPPEDTIFYEYDIPEPPKPEDDDKIYLSVDEPPQLPGEDQDEALNIFLQRNIQYPPAAEKAGIEGRVVVQFVVEKDGSISDIRFVKSVEPSLDHEARRVCSKLPPFVPGRHNGHPVRVLYTLPIDFRLPDDDVALNVGELTEDATLGDVIAQYKLGSRYYWGKGVRQDYGQAAHWLQLAHAQGYDKAGDLLLMALVLNKDYAAAARCYQKLHHADALPDTGDMLYELGCILSNREHRVSLLTQAAEQGCTQAMLDLTCLYAELDAFDPDRHDEAKAVDYYRQYLSSTGLPSQNITIADVYYHIANDSTSNVIVAKNDLDYLTAAARLGHTEAQTQLGMFYYQKGLYYNSGYYAQALELFEQAMRQGSVVAKLYLGYMYANGYGVEQDWDKCIDLVGQAARQGDADAQCYLGCRYLLGEGVPQDRDKAVDWLVKSAKQGHDIATWQLLNLYEKGLGKRAVDAFRRLADSGYGMARHIMGLCYYYGDGVKRDYDQAIEWLQQATESLDYGISTAACADLARVYVRQQNFGEAARVLDYGEETDHAKLMYYIARKIYPDKEYLDLLQDAARLGNHSAQHDLACVYAMGKDVKRDDKKALELYRQSLGDDGLALMELQSRNEVTIGDVYRSISLAYGNDIIGRQRGDDAELWLKKAAQAGNSWAIACVVNKCEQAEDYAQAIPWLRKLADHGDKSAMCSLADYYEHGKGVAADHRTAIDWYQKAADQGDAFAQNIIGECYMRGDVLPKDPQKAVEMFQLSSSRPFSYPASYNLGLCYYEGVGVDQDYKKAAECFKMELVGLYNLGLCSYEGLGVEQDYKKYTECIELSKLAVDTTRTIFPDDAAVDSLALAKQACRYLDGEGVDRDERKAVELYNQYLDQTDATKHDATLADLHYFAYQKYYDLLVWGEASHEHQHSHLEQAATLGLADAQFELANEYSYRSDDTQAAIWYARAAQQGHLVAQEALARCYRQGEGVQQDHVQAFEWMKKAADQGDAYALYEVAEYYSNGKAGNPDTQLAKHYYHQAATAFKALAEKSLKQDNEH